MNMQKNLLRLVFERILPWVVLAILLTYSYAKFYGHPYGFRWSATEDGLTVVYVFEEETEPTLKEGDHLIQIDGVTADDFRDDLRKTFFNGYKPGDVVPIVVERNGQTLHIDWVYPSKPNPAEFQDQLVSEWLIAYFFWFAGTFTVLVIRPRNTRWLLLTAFSFLTAIWLIAGSGVSTYHIWYSALVLRVAIWLCVAVYLHLHWVFPRPFGKLAPLVAWILYGTAIVLALAQAFQLLPSDLYLIGFLVAVGGSLLLLIIHIWRQPFVRRDLRFLFIVALVSLGLPVIWEIISLSVGIPARFGSFGVVSLVLLPLAYPYAAYRRQFGALELRVNRFITVYLFLALLGTIGVPLLASMPNQPLILQVGITVSIVITLVYVWGYPTFQGFVERRILGIPLPSKRLLETYSNEITTSVSLADLTGVLQEEIVPTLLVRQFAFLRSESGGIKMLSAMGVDEDQIPRQKDDLPQQGVYLSPDLIEADQPHSWIRLVLPLRLGDETIGFWLFGRRDPDDHYSQAEIPILQSLANQTAIALSNIVQTERLKALYEANIERYEQERSSLGRDLHDTVLNEIAAILIHNDAPVFSPAFQEAFEAVTERLREIVSELRPPALNYGLKLALEALVDNLSERSHDSVKFTADIWADGDWRYPEKVESYLYRIAQEACGNSLKYAHANTINVMGKLSQDRIELEVRDDGVGFDTEIALKPDGMAQTEKHYGLVGMRERAELIGAEISIHSKPKQGTRIRVTWKAK